MTKPLESEARNMLLHKSATSTGTLHIAPFNFGDTFPSVRISLEIVSATFLLVSFLSINESTYQTRKSAFYFTSKALSILEKIKF